MHASTVKAFATAAFVAMAAGSVASAADMAPRYTKAPPPVVEVWTWDKFYVGLNGGYSWGRSDTSGTFFNNVTGLQVSPTQSSVINLDGWVFGLQAGKNWQFGNWVAGIEADGQWTGEKGDRGFICVTGPVGGPCNIITGGPGAGVAPTTTFNQHIEWFVTLRPRVGVLVSPSALLYVTGGLAVAGIQTDGVLSGFAAGPPVPVSAGWSHESTRFGWVIGAGLEARLGGNWTGKIEGLYMDYGTVSGSATLLTNAPPLRFNYASDITDVVVRAGVNYHFGGPVVAKY